MREGVAPDDGLVRLNRHIHKVRDHPAHRSDPGRVDVGQKRNVAVALYDHSDFLQCRVAGALAHSVDGDLALARTGKKSGHCVGRGHTEVVVAMSGDDSLLNPIHIVNKILDLGRILGRKAVTCRVRNIHDSGPGLDGRLDHSGKVLIVRTPGVLSVEFHILDIFLGIFHSSDSPLKNLLPGGIELVLYVGVGSSDPCVYPLVLGVFEGFRGHIDVFLHRACQSADRRPGDGLGNLHDRIEISGTGNRETSLYHIHAQLFKAFATWIFSTVLSWHPGTCSPSRKVVSKMNILSELI